MKNKKAQVAYTISWFFVTIIIVFILITYFFISFAIFQIKKITPTKESDKKIYETNIGLEKSFYSLSFTSINQSESTIFLDIFANLSKENINNIEILLKDKIDYINSSFVIKILKIKELDNSPQINTYVFETDSKKTFTYFVFENEK